MITTMFRLAAVLTILLIAVGIARAQDVAKKVVGRWVSQSAEKQPLVFKKDGVFEYGWKKTADGWEMAAGSYKIEAGGKIRGTIAREGVNLGVWYVLTEDGLQGPRGPNPKMTWQRDEKKRTD
jgi:uncharacterized protein (TIGR03066 family)